MQRTSTRSKHRRRILIILTILVMAATGTVAAVLYVAHVWDELREGGFRASFISLQYLDHTVQSYAGRHGLLPEESPLHLEPYPHWRPITTIRNAAREREIWEPTEPPRSVEREHPLYGFIVAIENRPSSESDKKGYIVLGQGVKIATEDELAKLLAEDDRRRQEIGETRLWRDVDWR